MPQSTKNTMANCCCCWVVVVVVVVAVAFMAIVVACWSYHLSVRVVA